MKFKLFTTACFIITGLYAQAQTPHLWKTASSGGFSYRYVTNDPTQSRFYTLKNGLTVILSQNNKEPNITFKMAVRAGSNTDPKTNTGLAHYLEHLLFKGTDRFGTKDYKKEKPLLDQVERLYQKYILTTAPEARKAIYKEIDSISGEASKYSIANEYDKMMKTVGSQGTNAHTSVEETVYEENLPSNAVDKFLKIQAERFRAPVFRLFHTELEAVYEEKNRGLDNDMRKMYEAMMSRVFPTHNYGQQTTIGTVEHLKNPSLVEIRKYYNTYYVPNNMAIIMAGDISYDELISRIDKDFAYMVPKVVPQYSPAPEQPLMQVQTLNIYGPSPESLLIAYRGFAQNTKESAMLDLIGSILSNGKAGLMDINISQGQQMLSAGAGYTQMKDYGVFMLNGSPKAGQSLGDARKMLLEQVRLLKDGRFDEGLIKATVANIKLAELQALNDNGVRAEAVMTAFIQNKGMQWDKSIFSTDQMSHFTKNEVVDFANRFFGENYIVVNKLKGQDRLIDKVEKPIITAVFTNSNEVSAFVKNIIDAPVKSILPKFMDYAKDITFAKAKSAEVLYVKNTQNSIFRMSYRFNKGSYNNKLLPFAAQYLNFLGTDKLSSEDIGRKFYDIACSYSVNVGAEVTTVSVTGLQENFVEAVTLLEQVLAKCQPNEKALEELKSRIIKSRENAKLDKSALLSALTAYAQYGADNPFNYGLSNQEIQAMDSKELTGLLQSLNSFKHSIIYYGPKPVTEFIADLTKLHPIPDQFSSETPMKKFVYSNTDSGKIYFANYDMIQTEIKWVRNAGPYDPQSAAKIILFNNYFGGGMGSVVFQTIREAKALAYSTYAVYGAPNSLDKQNVIVAYVGAQSDKMKDALSAMNALLNELPASEKAFNVAKANTLNAMETARVTEDGVIYAYLADKKMGSDNDPRKEIYDALKLLTFEDLKAFHQQRLSGKSYSYCIVGDEKRLDMKELSKIGTIDKVDLKTLFGY